MYSTYFYGYRRHKLRQLLRPVLGLLILGALLFPVVGALVASAGQGLRGLVDRTDPGLIMGTAVPLMAWSGDGETPQRLASPGELARPLVGLFVLDRQDPLHMLQAQMPLLQAGAVPEAGEHRAVMAPEPGATPPDDEANALSPAKLTADSLVAVYFTHTGETYALTDGMERLHGKKGGVVKVGEALKAELEEVYGIRVALSDKVNDTDYGTSYVESQETLRQLLEENPAVQVVLDIHRDAGKPRENSLVTVHGREVAPVLIVVGSDARSAFPTWRQNYDFARELAAEIEKQHPGLCLGVQIKEGRYNQFLHPGAVLLEVGSVSNSTAEAVETGRLLAGPVAEMIRRTGEPQARANPPPGAGEDGGD